ncbi:cation:dicarboxylase symporter family transporter, partial [Aeromonas caviae]|uniref:cation:dicarboxylate symporter family transporter n=1 Tax=Aeromonas caviae TaxID=648 RepID=UPI00214F03DF
MVVAKDPVHEVILAITIGICLGHVYPSLGADMKPLGDGFVKLIKMIIAPVIFCTVVTGIAGMESMKAVGKTGAIALIYFEVVSTLALITGLTHQCLYFEQPHTFEQILFIQTA